MTDVTVLNDGSGRDDIGGTILIHSQIKKGDFASFLKAADRLKQILSNPLDPVPPIRVELDTPGGDVMEAVKIGRVIHERFMTTVVRPERECDSACVFVLIAGAIKLPTDLAHVGLHRPRFDAEYFARLTPDQARVKYNSLIEYLKDYFVKEMGGSEEAFRLMLSTPSDSLRLLSAAEMDRLGLRGEDPAWDELINAKMIERYGPIRWPLIKRCIGPSGDIAGCEKRVYEQYPAN
ncbi:MAG: hypothetical protein JOY62_09165 [Acidobacteriaceae bacterium]|nr:hypothetical protein [Acidobacteriaceae bacterium]